MTDLIVIGGGIAGSCVTTLARERGWDVELWDAGAPASCAALCVLRPSWHPLTEDALDFYAAHGWLRPGTTARRSTYRQPGVADSPGWFSLSPTAPLVRPDVADWATMEMMTEPTIPTVVATGHRNHLLPGKALHGFTAVADAPEDAEDGVRVHEMRPRHTIESLVFDGEMRLGSSSGLTADAAGERLIRMVAEAEAAGIALPHWNAIHGVRWMPDVTDDHVARPSPTVWTIGRLGKLGYTLSPHLAARVLSEIEDVAA